MSKKRMNHFPTPKDHVKIGYISAKFNDRNFLFTSLFRRHEASLLLLPQALYRSFRLRKNGAGNLKKTSYYLKKLAVD